MKQTNTMNKNNLLYKYVGKLAIDRAEAIETFIYKNIPSWQRKLMLRIPFTARFFGWRLEEQNTLVEKGKTLTRIDLYRWDKPKDTLMIIETTKTL